MERGGRVRQLNLTLSVPTREPAAIAELQRITEQRFLTGVLAACERAVRRAMGDGIQLFIRRLDVRWEVGAADLDSGPAQARLGVELAQAVLARLEAMPRAERRWPRRDAEVAVFESEGHLRAAYLAAALRGEERSWFFRALADEPDVWRGAIEGGPEVVRELLDWLVELQVGEAVIDRLDEAAVERLAEVLPPVEWPIAITRMPRMAALLRRSGVEQEARPAARDAPAVEGDARSRADSPVTEGARRSEPSAEVRSDPAAWPARREPEADDVTSGAPATITTGTGREISDETPGGSTASSTTVPSTPSSSSPGGLLPSTTPRAELENVQGGVDSPVTRPAAPGEATADATLDEMTQEGDSAEEPDVLRSDHAGLVYLVGLVLELELGAALYYAGVPEGPFLGHITSLLAGSPEDPAPWALAGSRDGRPFPLSAVAGWAAEEVTSRARQELGARLRARGLPCPLDDELAEAIDETAASLILAARDAGHDEVTAASLARCAAALAHLFLRRLAAPVDLAALRERLRVPGRLEWTDEALVVTLPMAAVDLELRRAGLDFTPGWVPWLQRKVLLEFEDPDGAW